MKRELLTYLVNAFTNRPFNGNATGVVIDSVGISDEEMKRIATDLNQHETVFIKKLDVDRYDSRFFTSSGEIDLCGHATIATFFALAKEEYITPIDRGTVSIIQHTKCGKIPVNISYRDEEVIDVSMLLNVKDEETSVTKCEMASILGIKEENLDIESRCLPIKKISSGIKDIVVPVNSLEALSSIKLDEKSARELLLKEGAISILAFATEDFKTVYSRTFSPTIGILEEPTSGTSCATVLKYLMDENLSSNSIESVQGISFGRTGRAYAEFLPDLNKIKVSGSGFVFLTGVLNL